MEFYVDDCCCCDIRTTTQRTITFIRRIPPEHVQVFKKGLFVVDLARDTYKVAKAFNNDCEKRNKIYLGKRTASEIVSMAGGQATSLAGTTVGAYIGGGIGAAFGGAGAAPGAFIGGAVGGFVGKMVGRKAAKAALDEAVSDSEDSD